MVSKKEILDEFLISWKNGASPKSINNDLVRRKYNKRTVSECRKIFEKWIKKPTAWSKIVK